MNKRTISACGGRSAARTENGGQASQKRARVRSAWCEKARARIAWSEIAGNKAIRKHRRPLSSRWARQGLQARNEERSRAIAWRTVLTTIPDRTRCPYRGKYLATGTDPSQDSCVREFWKFFLTRGARNLWDFVSLGPTLPTIFACAGFGGGGYPSHIQLNFQPT